MAESLGYMYHPGFFDKLCPVLDDCIPGFETRQFIFSVFDNEWPDLELHGRIRKITRALHRFMPSDFVKAARVLTIVGSRLMKLNEENTYPYIFLVDYVELHGLDHPVESLNCLEELTKLVSAEFAVDQFAQRYPVQTSTKMKEWSLHSDDRVRRLARRPARPGIPELVAVS